MTKACGCMDRKRSSLGTRWAGGPRRVSQWEDDGGGGLTPGLLMRERPPEVGHVIDLFFVFLGEPTKWRRQELLQAEGVDRWPPTGVVVLD